MPRFDLIGYALAALLAIGAGIWFVDVIGDRREAAIEERIREATRETQEELDAVAERLATAEGEARALAARLANSRMEIENANRASDPCRASPGLMQRLEGRWGPPPAATR